jgi:hypothetical protein
VVTACSRKRSGAASQPGIRSKKSNVLTRAASASTPAGVIASTAFGTVEIFVFFAAAVRFAIRSTVITSETSDSIAATTSPAEVCSSRTRRSTRLRDSASAGNSSSASKAAVSRRPWPSLSRTAAAAAADARSCTGLSAALLVLMAGRPVVGQSDPFIGTGARKVEEFPSYGRARSSAESIRASVSSRPRSATDSKIPGETVDPVIATRIGW